MVYLLFVLFDTVTALFYPVIFLLIAGIIALIFWKKLFARILLSIALLYFYCSASGLLPLSLMRHLETSIKPITVNEIVSHHAMILLGGGMDNYPHETEPSTRSYARVLEAYKIYRIAQAHHVQYTIFLSGGYTGKNKHISEAELYRQILLQVGIPSRHLVIENRSLDTYQNAKYLKPLLKEYPSTPYLLVTSALHMPRAMRYFKYFNIDTIAAPSDYPYTTVQWIPKGYNLWMQQAVLSEYIDALRFDFYHLIRFNSRTPYPSQNTY
jgi:uncharacterized SAM-binding protein YcdF (DUF218 family)